MFCPKCKSEYVEGFTHCKKCDVDLVDNLPDEHREHKAKGYYLPSIDPVAVKYVSNAIDAEMMMEILRINDIPCFRKSREAGGYMSVLTGFSVFGEDIYVDRKNAQAALDILNDWDVVQKTSSGEPIKSTEHYDNTPAYKRHRLAARIFSIYFAITIILVIFYLAVNVIKELLHN